MSNNIRIRLDGITGTSGALPSNNDKEAVVHLSIQLVLSMNDIQYYNNKPITIDDLKQILDKRL